MLAVIGADGDVLLNAWWLFNESDILSWMCLLKPQMKDDYSSMSKKQVLNFLVHFFFITSQYQTTLVSPITQLSTRKFANVNTCLHGIFSNTEGKAPSSIIHKVTDTQHRPVSTVPILSPRKQSQSCPLVLTVMDGCGNLFTVVLLGNPIKINTLLFIC